MRFLVPGILLIVGGCGQSQEEYGQADLTAPETIISDNPNSLLFFVNSEMALTRPLADSNLTGFRNGDGYELSYMYETESDSFVTNAFIQIICDDSTALHYCYDKIQDHLNTFSDNVSKSGLFTTWILPLSGKPLIEIDLFVRERTNSIRLEVHKRQYI